jgi:hypothetical protein
MVFLSGQELLDFVNAIEPNERGCRIWPGILPGEYPIAKIKGSWSDKVSRLLLEQFVLKGPMPTGFHACHNCGEWDDPNCVAIEHLYVGTPAQNSRDRWSRPLPEAEIARRQEVWRQWERNRTYGWGWGTRKGKDSPRVGIVV